MLKGHADILLMDAKTGEVVDERHEDNIVTNAVSDLINRNPFGYRGGITGQLPLATQALGGVLLFPDTITESTTDYFAHGQWPTGYASNGADPNGDPRRGNFNPNESYATSNGYRLVWDFGTADANGDISCVCLTNSYGGIGYELSEYAYTKRVDYGAPIYFYDGETTKQIQAYNNNCFYVAEWTEATAAGQTPTLKILKWQTPPNIQPLSREDRIDITSTTTIDISSTHIKSGTSRFPRRAFWDEYGYRIIVTDDRDNRDGNYYVVTVNWDGEVSEVAIPYGDMTDKIEIYSSGVLVAYVRKDWAYIPWKKTVNGTITMGFYAVQLSNTSNMLVLTSEITNIWTGSYASSANFYTDAHEPFWRIPMKDIGYIRYYWDVVLDNGKILFEGEYNHTTQGTQPTIQTTKPMALDSVYAMSADSYTGLHIYMKPTYLATINNLATPITKTADRTLKIIYTLTES